MSKFTPVRFEGRGMAFRQIAKDTVEVVSGAAPVMVYEHDLIADPDDICLEEPAYDVQLFCKIYSNPRIITAVEQQDQVIASTQNDLNKIGQLIRKLKTYDQMHNMSYDLLPRDENKPLNGVLLANKKQEGISQLVLHVAERHLISADPWHIEDKVWRYLFMENVKKVAHDFACLYKLLKKALPDSVDTFNVETRVLWSPEILKENLTAETIQYAYDKSEKLARMMLGNGFRIHIPYTEIENYFGGKNDNVTYMNEHFKRCVDSLLKAQGLIGN